MKAFQITVKVMQFQLLFPQLPVPRTGYRTEENRIDCQKEYKENILREKCIQFVLCGICRRFPLYRCHVTPSLSYAFIPSKFSFDMLIFSI